MTTTPTASTPDEPKTAAEVVDAYEDQQRQRLERVQRLLAKLDSSQDSIVGASSYILQLCGKAPSFATIIVKLIVERMPTGSGPEKVSLVYLVNDLIQRSKIRQKGPPFFDLFKPYLETTLAEIFSLTSQLDAQQKLEILKVVDVWRQRRVYEKDFGTHLYGRLVEESGLQHLLQGQKGQHDRVRVHTSDLKHFRAGTLYSKTGETILDLECSQWVLLAQKLENSAENRVKLVQLEKRLTSMLMGEEGRLFDEVEAQAMIDEYQVALNREIYDIKLPMLSLANNDLPRKIDNKMVEQMVFLDRIDALVDKVAKIEEKLEKDTE